MASRRERLNLNLSEETENFLMKEFFYLLQISGVFSYSRGKWYYISMVHYILFILILGSSALLCFYSTAMIKDYQLSIAAQTLHIGGGTIVCIAILLWLPYNRDTLIELASLTNSNFYDYGPSFDTTKVKPWIKQLKDFKNMTFKYLVGLLALIGAQALVGGPVFDKIQGMEITETFINSIYMHAPVPLWVPFEVDNNVVHCCIIFYEMMVTLALLSVLCSGIFLIIYFFHAINTSCRVLNESVADVEKRAMFLYREKYNLKCRRRQELYEDEDFRAEYGFCLKQNVEHHNVIIRAHDLIDHLQKWPMLFVVFFMSVVIACALFTVLKGDKRISPQLFSLLLLAMELIAIIIICWRGQEMIDTSNEFFGAFYRTQWFYCDPSVRKSIIIIQEKTKTPLTYKAGGLSNIDWELFGAIMNTAYTYFNVIFAMKDSEKNAT